MELSLEEIQHLAELSRIELSPEEAEQFRPQLEGILGYINRLSEVDTANIVIDGIADEQRPLGQDVPQPSSPQTRDALVAALPDRLGDLLRVPGVFDKPKS